MSEIDRVFAGLGGRQSAPSARRELRRIPGKGGASATRTVEVVRLPARGASESPGRQRADLQMRAATWEDGFPAQAARPMPPAADMPQPVRAEPTTHVMPMWERSRAEPESPPPPEPAPDAPRARRGRPPGSTSARREERRVADPFDPEDDGANCLRCGYAVESARERRGLLTCAACG
jgi:hypothetical protein